MSGDALLRAEDISLHRSNRAVLKDVNLVIEPDQVVTMIGPNGAGKTTLVRILLGLMAPDSGRVYRKPQLRIGYMPQRLHIEPTLPLTVKRFLRLARQQRHTIEQLLEEARISHLADQPMASLSGGEMQRVLLARALSRSPQLLVLDEPAQGVDVAGQVELYELVSDIRRRYQCAVLMISHDLHLVMANTDIVICLNQHICCHGRPEQVSHDPAYLSLFGHGPADALAVYSHQHNHRHNIAGDVVEDDHHG